MLLFRNAVVSPFTGVNKAQQFIHSHFEKRVREREEAREGEGELLLILYSCFSQLLVFCSIAGNEPNCLVSERQPEGSALLPSVRRLSLADLQMKAQANTSSPCPSLADKHLEGEMQANIPRQIQTEHPERQSEHVQIPV